ncbi:MAG: restriction endonuclease subunit S, partial [Moraxella sp.]|nr:restriction endonuclease subunit S [Moraxella sp.]
ITCQTADPVVNPSYVNQGKLQTFTKGFVAGAWGKKIDPKDFDNSRFAVGGNTYQNYLIQHLFAQVSDLVLVFVPQNALTASVSSEVEFREWLINQKHLKAVISLPSGLTANTGMACSLMVFDLKNEYDNVRFIPLKDTPFVQKNRLVDTKTLANIINGDDFDNAVSVSHDDIIAQNHVLDPERYVLNDDSKKAMAILANYQTVKLGDITDIIRPTPASRLKDEGDELMGEIQGGDLPPYGYISEVSKRSFVTKKAWQTAKSTQVQDGDIIMTIRGSTGKVGLVGQSLIDSHEMPLVVGQTGIIIRPHGDKVSPTALYMQLHSAFAQNRLALFSVGSAIAGLSVKDIKDFDIAILSQADEQKLIENFQKQCIINDEIIQKQQELARLSDEFWDN